MDYGILSSLEIVEDKHASGSPMFQEFVRLNFDSRLAWSLNKISRKFSFHTSSSLPNDSS